MHLLWQLTTISAEQLIVGGLICIAVSIGGIVAGMNGFGFAVIGTTLIVEVLGPQRAVTLMILPILAANLSLTFELDTAGLRSCGSRFSVFILTAAIGTLLGMISLQYVPVAPLKLALGIFVIMYVLLEQEQISVPGESWLSDVCLREGTTTMSVIGFVSGFVFGISNVGVQVIAYLRSFELDRSTIVGVLAMIFLGIGLTRVFIAGAIGLYTDIEAITLSVLAVFPGVAGVAVGQRVRKVVSSRTQRVTIFTLLSLIGIRLLQTGVTSI
ncbi:MAG: putative permease [Haloquadratum sp. J07HQX50]|jgi:Sulfite exporter TauE/SafE.|nr:MAG: putative permease [Haloquadratum sp. J07HQX50]